MQHWDDSQYEEMGWHDNHVYSFSIRECNDIRSDVILDLDYITEWRPGEGNAYLFLIAPATLTFHEVSELVISLDYSSNSAALVPFSIDSIDRISTATPGLMQWHIGINWPSGKISFIAKGYSQVLRAEPIECKEQRLPSSIRQHFPCGP